MASGTIYPKVKELEKYYLSGSGRDFEKGVKYLSEKERAAYEVFVQHDRIVDVKGNLVDTKGSISISKHGDPFESNKAIFVMSEEGNIYISKLDEVGKFHHSSFLAGEKIAAGGEIEIEQGIIKTSNNQTGHYRITRETNKTNLLKELSQRHYFSGGTNKLEDINLNINL